MGIFLVYILKSALCLAAFYLFYRLLLSRETLHRFNRVALLGVLLLSAGQKLTEDLIGRIRAFERKHGLAVTLTVHAPGEAER